MGLRYHSLDYIRGVASFLIMVYHYCSWSSTLGGSDSFLHRFGLYGVSIFYALSGLTLTLVYETKLNNRLQTKAFFIKRILRIFPLLWLCIIINILFSNNKYEVIDIFLNLSGLFSIFRYDKYIVSGSWSIGNELFFYMAFPLIMPIFLKKKRFNILFVSAVSALFFFAFCIISLDLSFEENWVLYINPINQIFFFLSGILIARHSKKLHIDNSYLILIGLVLLCFFYFLPKVDSKSLLIHGYHRIVYSILSVLLVLTFYKLGSINVSFIHRVLRWVGTISYSLYLLHPIIYRFSEKVLLWFNFEIKGNWLILIFLMLSSLAVSYVVYLKFELYFIRLYKSEK